MIFRVYVCASLVSVQAMFLAKRASFVFAQAGCHICQHSRQLLAHTNDGKVINVLHRRDQMFLHPLASSHEVLYPQWLQQSNALLLAEPDANSFYALGVSCQGSGRALHVAL